MRSPQQASTSAAPVTGETPPVESTPSSSQGRAPLNKAKAPEKTLALGIVIAMPNASNPLYPVEPTGQAKAATSDSEGEEDFVIYSSSALERGKMPALNKGEMEAADDEEHLETDLPELAFGIVEVDWKSNESPSRTGISSSGEPPR